VNLLDPAEGVTDTAAEIIGWFRSTPFGLRLSEG
jgi:hypothetical protein